MNVRQKIGTILIVLAVAFTVYLSVIMIRRINTVVLKAAYTKIFCNEFIRRYPTWRTKPTAS